MVETTILLAMSLWVCIFQLGQKLLVSIVADIVLNCMLWAFILTYMLCWCSPSYCMAFVLQCYTLFSRIFSWHPSNLNYWLLWAWNGSILCFVLLKDWGFQGLNGMQYGISINPVLFLVQWSVLRLVHWYKHGQNTGEVTMGLLLSWN